jgi:hypothetical protein
VSVDEAKWRQKWCSFGCAAKPRAEPVGQNFTFSLPMWRMLPETKDKTLEEIGSHWLQLDKRGRNLG